MSHDIVSVSTGMFHTCAIRSNLYLECWGNCYFNQCQIPQVYYLYKQVVSGGYFNCAVRNDHLFYEFEKIMCWGNDYYGTNDYMERFNEKNKEYEVEDISSGYGHVCAGIRYYGEGSLWMGELVDEDEDRHNEYYDGDGDNTDSDGDSDGSDDDFEYNIYEGIYNMYENLNGRFGGVGYVVMDYGYQDENYDLLDLDFEYDYNYYNNYIKENGIEYELNEQIPIIDYQLIWICWGNNDFGQSDVIQAYNQNTILKNSRNTDRSNHIRTIYTGLFHSCILTGRGRVSCFGYNEYAQNNPPATMNTGVHKLALGLTHSCGLRKDMKGTSEIQCWGDGNEGQLYIRDNGRNVEEICASQFHTCTLDSMGVYKCYGTNEFRQCDVHRIISYNI